MLQVLKRFLRPHKPDFRIVATHLSRINSAAFMRLKDRYEHAAPYPGYSKYLNAERFLEIAIGHFDWVGGFERREMRVLDIGTGAGYFPFVCANAGHRAEALDVPENDFYREITDLLGVLRHEHRIHAFQPLPSSVGRFDLITAFAVCFNAHGTTNVWGPDEWRFLLSNLRSNHICEGARLFLKLNREPDGTLYTDELFQFFRSEHATIDDDKIYMAL